MITKLTTNYHLETYPNTNQWQTKEAAIKCQISQKNAICATTEYYPFYLTGRVDYSNFSEDYQYHGKILPSPEPVNNRLTLYRVTPDKVVASKIQAGDVINDGQGKQHMIQSINPIRVYHCVSTRSLQSGDTIGLWQRWHFTQLLQLQSI